MSEAKRKVPVNMSEGDKGVAMTTATQTTQVVRPDVGRRSRASGTASGALRFRLVAEMAALALIAMLLIALPILSRGSTAPVTAATAQVIAQPGDTLWSVAQAHPLPGMTTAETADHIADLNHIESSRIIAGSSIAVPVTRAGLELACK